jgi:hypothetical protein
MINRCTWQQEWHANLHHLQVTYKKRKMFRIMLLYVHQSKLKIPLMNHFRTIYWGKLTKEFMLFKKYSLKLFELNQNCNNYNFFTKFSNIKFNKNRLIHSKLVHMYGYTEWFNKHSASTRICLLKLSKYSAFTAKPECNCYFWILEGTVWLTMKHYNIFLT